jgi:phage gp45-like
MQNIAIRIRLVDSDDTDKQQRVRATGRVDELLGSAKRMLLRMQNAGITSRPSAGTGLVINLGGNNDQALCVALENEEKRPKGLEKGETKVYDEFDQSLYFKDGEVILTATKLTINVTGEIVIDGSSIKLGAGATKFVKLADDSSATKVKAQ